MIKKVAMIVLVLGCILGFSMSSVSAVKSIYIDPNGKDTHDGLTKNTPKATIKNAIDTVDNNGKIILSKGTYKGKGNSKIIIDKNLKIIGTPQKTIIDGKKLVNLFTINPNCTVTFENIVFKNAKTTENGGAIYNDGGKCVIINSYFINNVAEGTNMHCGRGAAIYNHNNGNVDVINSTFTNNRGNMYGGAINNKYGNRFNVINSIFKNNHAYASGGAIDTNGGKYFNIKSSIFINNTARGIEGGAIVNKNSNLFISYSLFYNNHDENKIAVYNNNGNTTANYNFWGTNKIDNITRKVNINNYYKLTISTKTSHKKLKIGDKLTYNYYLKLNTTNKSKGVINLPKFSVDITKNNKKIAKYNIKNNSKKTTKILSKNSIISIKLFNTKINSFKYIAKS